MITSDQVSFVSKTLRICTIFNDSASGIHLCKTCKLFNFKTRLGDEICSSYKNMLRVIKCLFMTPSVLIYSLPNFCDSCLKAACNIPYYTTIECAYWVIFFYNIPCCLKKNIQNRRTSTLRANRLSLGELLLGKPIFGRNDLIPLISQPGGSGMAMRLPFQQKPIRHSWTQQGLIRGLT